MSEREMRLPAKLVPDRLAAILSGPAGLGLLALLIVLLHLFTLQRTSPLSDFADNGEYMQLAKNLLSLHHYSDIGLVADPNYYRPLEEMRSIYPPGYPFLIAIVWAVFGQSIMALVWLNIILLALVSAVIALLLTPIAASRTAAILMTLFWAILPLSTYMTQQVQSDIPFLAGIYAFLYLWERWEDRSQDFSRDRIARLAVLSLLLFLILATRTIGIALMPAVLAYSALKNRALPVAALIVCLAGSVLLFLEGIVLPRNGPGYLGAYAGMHLRDVVNVAITNIQHTRWSFATTLDPRLDRGGYVGTAISLAALALAALGLWKLRRTPPLPVFFLLVYGLMITVFPDNSAWSRYLYPVIPIILALSAAGLSLVFARSRQPMRPICVLVFVLGLSACTAYARAPQLHRLNAGYPTAQSREVLSFVRDHTAPSDIVASTFPYLTSFEINRASLRVWPQQLREMSDPALIRRLRDLRVGYLLIKSSGLRPVVRDSGWDYSDKYTYGAMVARNPGEFELLMQNADYGFYRLKQ